MFAAALLLLLLLFAMNCNNEINHVAKGGRQIFHLLIRVATQDLTFQDTVHFGLAHLR